MTRTLLCSLLLLVSLTTYGQLTSFKGDTAATAQATRLNYGFNAAGRPIVKGSTGNAIPLTYLSELTYAALGGKPTTLSGFGITDGVSTTGSYANPAWLTSLSYAKLTNLPTTAAGYGITDAVVTGGSYTNPSWLVSIPYSKLTATPTTLAGYGITDAATSASVALKQDAASSIFRTNVASYAALGSLTVPSGLTYLVQVANDESQSAPYNVNQWYLKDNSGLTFKLALIKQ